ncbi:MAG TPA: M28 family peptidase [Bryobacteraceae bacterium]|nr:M28 family peptidase [Bryobacteraceae bacterium]
MLKLSLRIAGICVPAVIAIGSARAQNRAPAPNPQAHALGRIDDALLEWPLATADQRYRAIDGKSMHRYVVEQAEISRRYRDQGHPKFWGRIIGTSGDAEAAEWLAAKFNAMGLKDVRIQPIDLAPQWMPQSWEVSINSGGKTLRLQSAQPDYGSAGTPAQGLDVEAVYVGLGSEADFAGKDARGKAVFSFNMMGLKPEGVPKRADAKGAAAIFEVDMLPGNMRYEAYPSGTKAPAFTVGSDDGYAARDLIAAPQNQAPRVHVRLDVSRVPNLKTALVWGTLPGATDETIYIVAHRDGWFDAASDNGGGVASMLGLAEFYSKIPQNQRRRTMVFIGLDGHHNTGEGSGAGRRWLAEHRDKLFENTALMINCEHPSILQSYVRPRYQEERNLVWSNTFMAQQWYAGGPSRPELESITAKAFREFGAPLYLDPNVRPPAGDLGQFWRFVPGVATSEFYHYFHTDQDTPETVPWTGLEAVTRAYAKIIDEVNKLPLSGLKRPPEPESQP